MSTVKVQLKGKEVELQGKRNKTVQVDSLAPAYDECLRWIEYLKQFHPLITEERIVPTFVATDKICYGWQVVKNWNSEKGKASELPISYATLAKGSIEIGEAIEHELIHIENNNIWQARQDTLGNPMPVDMSREGAYHNQKFRDTAEKRGSYCVDPKERKELGKRDISWGESHFTPTTVTKIIAEFQPNDDAFTLIREDIKFKTEPRKPSPYLKWTCGCTNVRCATELSAICAKCNTKFEIDDIK